MNQEKSQTYPQFNALQIVGVKWWHKLDVILG